MTRLKVLSLAALVALGGMFAGCKSGSSTPPDSTPPAVTPATQPSMVMPNQGKPPEPPTTLEKPAASSMTHMLTKDEPFYPSMPGADAKSLGVVKSGAKCLVLIPGDTYSKVLTDEGATVYIATEGLEPIPAKR